MIKIQFIYLDGKSVEVELNETNFERFMQCVKSAEVFWDQDTGRGFLSDLSKIRYATFVKMQPCKVEKVDEASVESPSDIVV